MLAGETDFLLKIVAPDWDSYQRFLSGQLTAAPNVATSNRRWCCGVSKVHRSPGSARCRPSR